MKINLRKSIAIGASLAVAAGLSLVGNVAAQAAPLTPTAAQLAAWKGKEITYYFYNDGVIELDITKKQIADFEKLTGAKVKLDVVPFPTLDQQLQARIAGGNTPDVARLNNPALYWNVGLPIENYLGRNYGKEFLKGSTTQVTNPTTKKLIGVPYDLTINGPFVNVDLFEKAGVPVPTSWTWPELIATAKKVQAATKSEYAFAIDKTGHRVSTVMSQFGAYMVNAQGRNVLRTTPNRAEKAIKTITDLYVADLAPRDLWIGSGTRYSSPLAVFQSGQLPVFFSGNWQVGALSEGANAVKFKYAAVPNPTGLNGGGWPGGKFLVAFQASKTPDLAAFFVRYMANTEQMEEMCKAAFWMPTRVDLSEKGIAYPKRAADMKVFLADSAKTPSAAYGIQSVPTVAPTIYNLLRDGMTEVMAGKITVKQLVQNLIVGIDTQLATLKK
jgi:alpha-1,4-digalacturonate transport system substrate-binding protein